MRAGDADAAAGDGGGGGGFTICGTFAPVLTARRHSPRVVAGLMGHASTRMTLDAYAHAPTAAEEDATRDVMERM